MRVGRVVEGLDEGMPLERVLDDPALDASAAAVDQPDLPQARFVRRAHVFVDHRCHIARGKGVQIEDGLNWETVGHMAEDVVL